MLNAANKSSLMNNRLPSSQTKKTDQTENATLHEIYRSSTPENADYSSSSEDWSQPQTEMLQTVMHNTAHKNITADNKTTYSHHL